MNPGPDTIREYLLGRLPAPEEAELESYFTSGPEAQLLLEVSESTLIDDYAMELLPLPDRRAFEQAFLTTGARRESLAMTRGIIQLERRRRTRRWLMAALGASAVALLAVVLYLRPPPASLPALSLLPNATRGALPPEISLAAAPATLVLELRLPDPPPSCTATMIRIGDPQPILTLHLPRMSHPAVRVAIDKAALVPGEYSVTLASREDFQRDFVFRLTK